MPGVTRIAPSPTGYLHLGHVAHLLYVVGVAKKEGLSLTFRLEDHDRQRCKPAYEEAILADLRWLAIPGLSLENPHRQSDSPHVYQAALERLEAEGLLYACDCSRKDLAQRVQHSHGALAPGTELPYDGHCRDRGLPITPTNGLRLRLPAETVPFEDARLGHLTHNPASQCGDLLVRDRHGQLTYQFAVVVDDIRFGITYIVRGEDLLASTGRQLLLRRLLGEEAPVAFYHHPLLTNAADQKLAKRDRSAAISERRLAGEPPEAILADAAAALGWVALGTPITWHDAAAFV